MGMRKEKGEQRWGQGIHHQWGQLTNPRSSFSGTPEAMAHVATHCEHVEQENLDAQNGWRHPVPALMTHVLVPLEKSASRLSCLSYKICLHNVQLHPTHTIPHPWHLDHRDKCHLKRLPTECLFLRRCLAFGKTDRKKLSHMQCMFLSHFKHVLMPIMQPAFFTSGQTKQTAFTASSNSCFQELHHTHPLSPTKMTSRMVLPSQSHDIQRTFLRLCRYSSGAKGLELSLAYMETLWDWSLNVWQHKMQLIWPLGRWVTDLYWKHQVRSSWGFGESKEFGGWRCPWSSPWPISHGPGWDHTTQNFTHSEDLETLQRGRFWTAFPREVVKHLRALWLS